MSNAFAHSMAELGLAMTMLGGGDTTAVREARVAVAKSKFVRGDLDCDEYEHELDILFGLAPEEPPAIEWQQ